MLNPNMKSIVVQHPGTEVYCLLILRNWNRYGSTAIFECSTGARKLSLGARRRPNGAFQRAMRSPRVAHPGGRERQGVVDARDEPPLGRLLEASVWLKVCYLFNMLATYVFSDQLCGVENGEESSTGGTNHFLFDFSRLRSGQGMLLGQHVGNICF